MSRYTGSAAMFFSRDAMQQPHAAKLNCGQAIVWSARCPGKVTANEDAAAILSWHDLADVLIVADGLGGHQAGEVASRLAIESIEEAIAGHVDPAVPLRAAIVNGIELANRRILELGVGAGTTLAVAEIQDRDFRPYHIGDAEIMLAGRGGKIKWQSVSHSPVSMGVEAGMLSEEDAMHHEDRHLVTNVVGCDEMRIDIGPTLPLAGRDTILLASDGLFDNLRVEEIIGCLESGTLRNAVARMAGACDRRMQHPVDGQPCKPDDLTIVAFRTSYRRKAQPSINASAEAETVC